MSDIADFLRARYAERRALAVAASPGPWHANAEHDEVLAVDGITVAEGFALSGRQVRATVDHIVANDPADVIADCDAKQRLLAVILAEPHATLRPGGSTAIYCVADSDPGEPCECGRDQRVSEYVRILAQQFAGHPDHKGEEWAP
jgi:hypothetical protein